MTPDEVVRRYQERYGRLKGAAVAQVLAAWDKWGGLSDDDAERFVAAAVPVVNGAQVATAALVAGYVGLLAGSPPPKVPTKDITGLRGVPVTEVYQRPVIAARSAIAQGKTFPEAMAAGRTRAEVLADADVMLAQREAMARTAKAHPRITGYRRVLSGGSCDLCASVSDDVYSTDDLMPIHDRCGCGVAPVFSDEDPADDVNEDRREPEAKPAVHTHGELGPVLTEVGQHFTPAP